MKFFGFEIKRSKKKEKPDDFVRTRDKGATTMIVGAGGRSIDQMTFFSTLQEDKERIETYRKMALSDYVSDALSDIKNECIIKNPQTGEVVEIDLSRTNFSANIKKKIAEEFEEIKSLMSFNKNAATYFLEWYIDGRQFFYLVSGANKTEGLKEIRKLDARFVQRTRKIEYDPNKSFEQNMQSPNEEIVYHFLPPEIEGHDMSWMTGLNDQNVTELTNDSIAYSDSNIFDSDGNCLSYLDRAIKAFNQLDMMEDHLVIYRVTRSIEKMIYKIGIGNLSPAKVEQEIKGIIDKFRSEEIYDSASGKMRGQYQSRAMREDIFLPVRGNSMDTQIDQMRGAENLGQIEDIIYFRKRLYKALFIPLGRLDSEGGFQMSRRTEITREEIKFANFARDLTDLFSEIFSCIMKRHLVLKKVITDEEWKENEENIQFEFTSESLFKELMRLDVIQERFNLMRDAESYKDVYLSKQWIEENILNFSEDQVKRLEKQRKKEAASGENDDDNKIEDPLGATPRPPASSQPPRY